MSPVGFMVSASLSSSVASDSNSTACSAYDDSWLGFNQPLCTESGEGDGTPPTPVRLPGKSHGWRSLVDCSLWGREESDMTERLHFHFSLSRIGEGNGNPPQCSCLENLRDRGAWWAAVYGVALSWTRLKRLSSRSSGCTDRAPGTQLLTHSSCASWGYQTWEEGSISAC